MVTNYHPKNPYYDLNRIQKQAKDLISTCFSDRELVLAHFQYLMAKFEKDPEALSVLQEATKTLPHLAKTTDKVVKVLDILTKLVGNTEDESLSDKDLQMLKSFAEMKK